MNEIKKEKIVQFFRQMLEVYDFELVIDINKDLENVFIFNISGSSMICSTTPRFIKSAAVSFITPAASSARLLSFQRIDANPSGDRIE